MALIILHHEREDLETKIEKMNRRATKLGLNLPPISAEFEPTVTRREVTKDVWRDLAAWKVTLSGEVPRINGWALVCRVEHTEAGCIVTGPTGVEQDLSEWHNCPPTCDHCKTTRNRKDTFVLQNEAGETIRIGRSCLADFVRSPDAEKFADAAMWGDFFRSELDGGGEGFWLSPIAFPPVVIVAFAQASIRVDNGYRKAETDHSTRSMVSYALRAPHPRSDADQLENWRARQPTPEETALAETIVAWAKVQTETDYLHNLAVSVSLEAATPRTWGLLVSVPQAYARATGTAAARKLQAVKCDVPAEFEGKRVKLEGEALAYKWQENAMGDGALKVLLRFTAEAGEWKGWMTASLAETESSRRGAGDLWTVTARVARKDFGFAILSRPTKCSVAYAQPADGAQPDDGAPETEPDRASDPFAGFGDEPTVEQADLVFG